jgi:hypothetical protein
MGYDTPQGQSEPIASSFRGAKRIQRRPALSVLHTILALLDAEILRAVLDAYERVFEAVAQAQRSRKDARLDHVVVISAGLRRDFESARGAVQTLFETFAHEELWSSA